MSMFQKSVLKKTTQDEALVSKRWSEYQKFKDKIDFIENTKEEKYQEGFFRDIFENCLGYTLDTTDPSNFNLEREKKNETNSKKADGVIYVNNDVIGVIELKGQDTKDLDKVETQAFEYLVSHSFSKYVIVSNFDELRFYIEKKTAYEKFSLFRLTHEEFKRFHLLLSYESIQEGIPLRLKSESTSFEKEISEKLYNDFSLFRTHLYENLTANNNLDKALLLRFTQKLCDRIIFILFAEDRGFLSPNTIREIREEFANQKFTDYRLYDIYKFYFNAINTGNERLGISKYNGGLFSQDDILDSLVIDDSVLDLRAQSLSDYDFLSDISVNILGHIFEQSLTDLEEINASISNTEFDSKKSKRKKDGVFYTPEYITYYIVENTLGKLCKEKKEQLKITEITAPKNLKNLSKKTKTQKENLEEYRSWLLNLKILDPACGSGAFLNQALEFLIREHTALQKNLVVMGDVTAYYEIEKSILEHNLYGVDVNEDAVEIARLSLWLRTAEKGRELTKLADKIKCGNSLIEDGNVTDNPFVWENEFSEVFEQGGFDAIIGNPPYVATKEIPESDRDFFWAKYKDLLFSEMDLYELFLYDNMDHKLKDNGYIGFITPNSYYTSVSFKHLRKYMVDNFHIMKILDFPYRFFPFEDVNTETSILIAKKSPLSKGFHTKLATASKDELNKTFSIDDSTIIKPILVNQGEIRDFFDYKIVINQSKILTKLLRNSKRFGDYLDLHKGWMSVPKNTIIGDKTIDQGIFSKKEVDTLSIHAYCNKYLEGQDIHRYYIDDTDKYVSISDIAPKTKAWHFSEKIILQRIVGQNKNKIFATYDSENHIIFPNANLVNIIDNKNDIKFFLALLNSRLISYFYNMYFGESNTNLTKKAFESIPIMDISRSPQHLFSEKVDLMLDLSKRLIQVKQNFIVELGLEKVSKRLQDFEKLDFNEFIEEYAKSIKLKFVDKLEERNFKNQWRSIFENDSKIALKLKREIERVDLEIDEMVYALYGLNESEVKLIES